MKKGLISLLVLSLFVSIAPVSAENLTFSDVNQFHANFDAVMFGKNEGIVHGYADGKFKPDNQINRAEFTKIVINAVAEPSEIYGDNCFPDVKTEWYAPYVCAAARMGIVSGYADGKFKPNEKINFVEAAKIISTAYGYTTEADMGQYFQTWFAPYVKGLDRYLAIPLTVNSFEKKITRGEMIEMIYRLKARVFDKPSMAYDNLFAKNKNIKLALNAENVNSYNEGSGKCEEPFNNEEANTMVKFDTGNFSVNFPFNDSWGSPTFKVAPYFEYDYMVSFGAVSSFEACSWVREYNMTIKPWKSAEDLKKEIKEEEMRNTGLINYYSTTTYNGFDVVKYVELGMCSYPTLEVVGPNGFNYSFTPTCSVDDKEEFGKLWEVVKTVKFY